MITSHHFCVTKDNFQDPSFSFLLVQDHALDLIFLILDREAKSILTMVKLSDLTSTLICNSNPFSLLSTLTQPINEDALGLCVMRSETERNYEIDNNIRGVKINNAEMTKCYKLADCFLPIYFCFKYIYGIYLINQCNFRIENYT